MRQLVIGDLVVSDVEPLEPELVLGASHLVRSVEVGRIGVLHQLAELCEASLQVADVELGDFEPLLCSGDLDRHPLQFVSHQTIGKRVVVGELEEFPLLALQSSDGGLEPIGLGFGSVPMRQEQTPEDFLEPREPPGDFISNRLVVLLDSSLGFPYRDVALRASVLPLPSETVEVLVGAAAPPAVHEAHSALAVAASKRAFEVLPVPPGLVAAGVVAGQDCSHPIEGLSVGQWLVLSRMVLAAPHDNADVVGIRQDVVDAALGQRPLGIALGGPRGQSSIGEGLGHLRHGVVAGGERLEGPGDQSRPRWIDDDAGHVCHAVDFDADVPVADRCSARGAPATSLLGHLGRDLFGQLGRVHLSQCEVHDFDQLA